MGVKSRYESSMSYVAPHRYQTRFQAKKQHVSHSEYMRNMSHLNLLYTITQTVNHEERINALTEVYRFLQEFQPWKESACLYASIQRKIRRLLDDEIPVEIERVSTNQKTDGILFDLFELEHTLIRLDNLMKM